MLVGCRRGTTGRSTSPAGSGGCEPPSSAPRTAWHRPPRSSSASPPPAATATRSSSPASRPSWPARCRWPPASTRRSPPNATPSSPTSPGRPQELEETPEVELEELTQIYEHRGLDRPLARQVAIQLTKTDALASHVRDELGIDDTGGSARPLQAAVGLGGWLPDRRRPVARHRGARSRAAPASSRSRWSRSCCSPRSGPPVRDSAVRTSGGQRCASRSSAVSPWRSPRSSATCSAPSSDDARYPADRGTQRGREVTVGRHLHAVQPEPARHRARARRRAPRPPPATARDPRRTRPGRAGPTPCGRP